MLVAKGYGSASPVAGNDSLEGRLRNRRIEYRVMKGSAAASQLSAKKTLKRK